ncbi:TPA: deoxynucleoside kinase [Candidatus Falkowbacteria bacterium]|nr:deoxynucleoside kinase [Candidatus Falkowbacteria bacterium]
MTHFITISGNIGAGKTTLSKILAQKLGWELAAEPVDENPYLEDFYKDMKRWAFHSQIFYLSKMAKHHFDLAKKTTSAIQDRSFYENAEIFAANLYKQKLISEKEWSTYAHLYRSLLDIMTPPDLIVYLQAAPEVLWQRIQHRSREAEKYMTLDYIIGLNEMYELWAKSFNRCPVLIYNIDKADLKYAEPEQEDLMAKIKQVLLLNTDNKHSCQWQAKSSIN